MDAFPKEEEGNERDQEAQHRCSCSEQGARGEGRQERALTSLTPVFKLEVRLLSSFRGASSALAPPPKPRAQVQPTSLATIAHPRVMHVALYRPHRFLAMAAPCSSLLEAGCSLVKGEPWAMAHRRASLVASSCSPAAPPPPP